MIIVTGGAGFIGSNIVCRLSERNEEVVIIDNIDSHEKWMNIKDSKVTKLVHPDQTMIFLENNKTDITLIIHMGAISSTVEKDINSIIDTNIHLSEKLWDFCVDNNKRFLYASSAATYGDGKTGYIDQDDLVINNKLKPLNPYGWSKDFFDRVVLNSVYSRGKHPEQYVGFKFFNVYGPNEMHKKEQKSMIANIFLSLKQHKKIKLFKSYKKDFQNGGQLRDFIWIKDVVDVIIWFVDNKDKNGIFNVGTGEVRSFKEMASIICEVLNIKCNIKYIDMPEKLKAQYQYYTCADISKLRSVGYKGKFTSLEDGVKEYIGNLNYLYDDTL